MSVDTVNTIVDITTLAEVQNELTNLADTKIVGVACTGETMATACKDPNVTCSAACTAPTVIVVGTPTEAAKKAA